MPIPWGATSAVVAERRYVAVTSYREVQGGVLQLRSTEASDRNFNLPQYFDVWLLQGASVHALLPYHTLSSGEQCIRMCSLLEWDPPVATCRSIQQYVERLSTQWWYRQWVGFSPMHQTQEGGWYAVDLFHQPPDLLHNSEGHWVWYVLLDCNEPKEYHRARVALQNGMLWGPDPY